MNIRRDEMAELEALLGMGSDIPKPDVFDLGVPVVLNELTDDELLFRESVIKTFFENATRSGHPVYGFDIETLERLHKEVVTEFKKRGRDYQPALDRHQKEEKKDIKRAPKDDEITVKVKEPNVQDLIRETAEKVAEEVVKRQPVSIPSIWTHPNPNYPGGDVYYGHNYTTSNTGNTGGDVNDEKASE